MKKFEYINDSRILNAEVTVALKLNQGTCRKRDVIFSDPLFCDTFFWQKKYQNYYYTQML
jgi:hypothetical protein